MVYLFYRGKRRKQKKSIISLKKGSAFEDLALIQELSDTITYAYNLKGIKFFICPLVHRLW